jgi:Protein of unknown function (DUF3047)
MRESSRIRLLSSIGSSDVMKYESIMRITICLITVLVIVLSSSIHAQVIFDAGKFSAAEPGGQFPAGWHPLTFKKIPSHTQYTIIKDGNTAVIKAVSRASASGLIRKIRIDPRKYPFIRWRWKVSNVYKNGDVTKKTGDDYPARIYITFEYDPDRVGLWEKIKYNLAKQFYGEYSPSAAINYIWASHAVIGTIVSNPYTQRTKMIVVESGKKVLNTWNSEERNIFDDYIRAFGEKPPMISGIAIMTDSDNTKEAATAFYGDIQLRGNKHPLEDKQEHLNKTKYIE